MALTRQVDGPVSLAASYSSYLSHSPVSVLDQHGPLIMEGPYEASKGSQQGPSLKRQSSGWEGHKQLVREPERPLRDWGAASPILPAAGVAEAVEGTHSWLEAEGFEDESFGDDLEGVPGWEEEGSDEGDAEFSGRESGDGEAMPMAMTEEEEDAEEWEELGMDLSDVLDALREESASPWLRPILEAVAAAAPYADSLSPSSSSDSSATNSSPSSTGTAIGYDWSDSQQSGGGSRGVSLTGRMDRLVRRLRQGGYEASVCTTAWASSQGVPAGSHTFIDIVGPAPARQARAYTDAQDPPVAPGRVVIDLDFASQFEVVKGTPAYEAFLQRIPSVFVGSDGTLLRLLELLVEAMRVSLASQKLPVAPWRRLRFVNAKWTAVVDRAVPAASSPTADTPIATFSPAAGALLVYCQSQEDLRDHSLSATDAALSGGALPVGGAPGMPRVGSGLVNLPSGWHAQGSTPAPMLAEPALLSALAAKAARRGATSPLHPKKPQQHFGTPPTLRQAGFNGHLSGAAAARSPHGSLLKNIVACSH